MPARSAVMLLLLVVGPPAFAKEVNPAQPAIAKQLESKKACIAVAQDVAERVLAMGTKSEHGTTFGKGPTVYDGDAGVALLFAGLYRATKEKRWLVACRSILDQATAKLPEEPGLYTGRAGIGQACLEAHWASGEKRFLEQAKACATRTQKYTATDIIFGAAGTGLFLLNLHRATGNAGHLRRARAAGDFLASCAVREDDLVHWPMTPGKGKRVYLGFSHGAAGIGYFLLHLGLRTKHAAYLELAEGAARFVLKHEDREGDERAHWWRTVPKSSDDRRIQWCHGAPGTGLFFHDLHRHLKKQVHTDALGRCLETTRVRGRGARASACQCHGVTGNAELFLEVFIRSGEKKWLHEARSSGSAVLVAESGRLRLKSGGTGAEYGPSYMLGLAGIGHFFLRLADPANTPLPMMVRD